MFENIIDKFIIVLVGTTHPGNIGAAARAMKTMNVNRLVLVAPKIFPSAEATARATGADDILANAELFPTLAQAIAGCNLVFATSARSRTINWPIFTPEQAAEKLLQKVQGDSRVAIVFGRENSGLSNDELELCNGMIQIPSNPDYSSLNLASAVQIVCYEVNKLMHRDVESADLEQEQQELVSSELMEMLYEHLQQCLIDIDYFDPEKPRRLMRRLKRLISRAELDKNEYNIIRGILVAAQEAASKKE